MHFRDTATKLTFYPEELVAERQEDVIATGDDRPLAERCPRCGSVYLLEKITKALGRMKVCPNEECPYKEAAA